MVLSPHCLVLCTTGHETQSHLFINCRYTDRFWKEITLAFRWFATFPNDISSFIIYTLNGHLFLDGKCHMDGFDSRFPKDHLQGEKQSTIQ
uniref:Reverse transcriptase zinc-binding domain-containing protein n=1 Tax=Cucumis melo TaxID=3656 RepID=A0A9I9EC70_CUCME